ncbi:MAG: hypothetical protein ACLSDQ_08480 [Adlercreutzia equolifaciens]
MTPHTHTKMIHGEPAAVRLEMPFLFVDQEGNRFMDETCCRMGYMNNFARPYLAKAGFADSRRRSSSAWCPQVGELLRGVEGRQPLRHLSVQRRQQVNPEVDYRRYD